MGRNRRGRNRERTIRHSYATFDKIWQDKANTYATLGKHYFSPLLLSPLLRTPSSLKVVRRIIAWGGNGAAYVATLAARENYHLLPKPLSILRALLSFTGKRGLEYRIPRLHSPENSWRFPEIFGDVCRNETSFL